MCLPLQPTASNKSTINIVVASKRLDDSEMTTAEKKNLCCSSASRRRNYLGRKLHLWPDKSQWSSALDPNQWWQHETIVEVTKNLREKMSKSCCGSGWVWYCWRSCAETCQCCSISCFLMSYRRGKCHSLKFFWQNIVFVIAFRLKHDFFSCHKNHVKLGLAVGIFWDNFV